MFRYIATKILLAISILIFTGCKSHSEPDYPPVEGKAILIYMIATNSLDINARIDIQEILEGAWNCDLKKNAIFIYECTRDNTPALYRITRDETECKKFLVRNYSDEISSVSPERISAVITDFRNEADAKEYGAVFWSHALGWIPSMPVAKQVLLNPGIETPEWFGDDYGKHINIPEFANAIPDNMFSFIWMDCCYMGSIEVAYQFRNKCQRYIGYPTEILADGMPYDITLPYLLSDNNGVVEAAAATFNYYSEQTSSIMRACTVSVLDMTRMDKVASSAHRTYVNFVPVDTKGLQCYSRGVTPPLYDFLQYSERVGQETGNLEALDELTSALNDMVIYKKATPYFVSLTIDPSLFSGLSAYAYSDKYPDISMYYQSLDWYKAVYK